MSERLRQIAKETMGICCNNGYQINGKMIALDIERDSEVIVNRPNKEYALNLTESKANIGFSADDSLVAAEKFVHEFGSCAVLNFASAKNPGGGFQSGANAQEERLARASTLYCSIGSDKASEMYRYNIENRNIFYSDYILYSPHVTVFRDFKENLTDSPFEISVITAPAVNRSIRSELMTDESVDAVMLARTRKLLATASENGAKNLVLGAWGCGFFQNKAESIAKYFRQVLLEENYQSLFDNIMFAIFEPSGRKDKLKAFCREFNYEIH